MCVFYSRIHNSGAKARSRVSTGEIRIIATPWLYIITFMLYSLLQHPVDHRPSPPMTAYYFQLTSPPSQLCLSLSLIPANSHESRPGSTVVLTDKWIPKWMWCDLCNNLGVESHAGGQAGIMHKTLTPPPPPKHTHTHTNKKAKRLLGHSEPPATR